MEYWVFQISGAVCKISTYSLAGIVALYVVTCFFVSAFAQGNGVPVPTLKPLASIAAQTCFAVAVPGVFLHIIRESFRVKLEQIVREATKPI